MKVSCRHHKQDKLFALLSKIFGLQRNIIIFGTSGCALKKKEKSNIYILTSKVTFIGLHLSNLNIEYYTTPHIHRAQYYKMKSELLQPKSEEIMLSEERGF